MIPKIIHYCWFGNNKIPRKLVKNIESWRKNNPDFKIIKWDESNFDITKANDFVKNAYLNKHWAFVSDYVRLYAIYNYGGVYLDTDVELLRPLDEVLKEFPTGYIGYENNEFINSGLGFAAERNSKIISEMMDYYNVIVFNKTELEEIACPILNTKILITHGLVGNNQMQKIDDIAILPMEYLCPQTLGDGKRKITNNTISIHQYNASWLPSYKRNWIRVVMGIKKVLPTWMVKKLRNYLRKNK